MILERNYGATTPVTGEEPENCERIWYYYTLWRCSRLAICQLLGSEGPIYVTIFINDSRWAGQECIVFAILIRKDIFIILNDMKLNYDGSLLAADFRMTKIQITWFMVLGLDDFLSEIPGQS